MSKPKKADPNKIVVSTPALPLSIPNSVGLTSDNPFTTKYTNPWDNLKNFMSGAYDAVEKVATGVGTATAALKGGKALYNLYKTTGGLKNIYNAYKIMKNPYSATFPLKWNNSGFSAPRIDSKPNVFRKYLNDKISASEFKNLLNAVPKRKPLILPPPDLPTPVLNPNWIPKGMSMTSRGIVPQPQNFNTFYYVPKKSQIMPNLPHTKLHNIEPNYFLKDRSSRAADVIGTPISRRKPNLALPQHQGLVFHSPSKYRGASKTANM